MFDAAGGGGGEGGVGWAGRGVLPGGQRRGARPSATYNSFKVEKRVRLTSPHLVNGFEPILPNRWVSRTSVLKERHSPENPAQLVETKPFVQFCKEGVHCLVSLF